MLVDSTFLNDLVRSEEQAIEKLEELIVKETPVAISPFTVYEVGIGLRGEAAQYRERFQTVVDDLDTAPLGSEQAHRALTIQRRLHDRGEPIGAVDVLIAGTAATRSDGRVLTRNVDEFKRVDSITVETY